MPRWKQWKNKETTYVLQKCKALPIHYLWWKMIGVIFYFPQFLRYSFFLTVNIFNSKNIWKVADDIGYIIISQRIQSKTGRNRIWITDQSWELCEFTTSGLAQTKHFVGILLRDRTEQIRETRDKHIEGKLKGKSTWVYSNLLRNAER